VSGTLPDAETLEIMWHDLENGSYAEDLALWRDLAVVHGGPVLDIGAGTGTPSSRSSATRSSSRRCVSGPARCRSPRSRATRATSISAAGSR
jgi:hypothetical protein